MYMKKLPNAPLQEVIFEGKWELSLDQQTSAFIDPEFQFALGKFQHVISSRFPYHKSKIPGDIPLQFLGHQPIHQFWTGEGVWPVIQLGPGVITVNDTEKNYEWDDVFFPLVKETLFNVKNAYVNDLSFISYTLRYIDVVKIKDYEFSNWFDFVKDNINFQFSNGYPLPGTLHNFKIEQSFRTEDAGLIEIGFSNGQDNQKEDIFIWQTAVTGRKPLFIEGLMEWLVLAHSHCSRIFKETCKEDFYASFVNR